MTLLIGSCISKILLIYAPPNINKSTWWLSNIPRMSHDIILGDFNFVENPRRDRISSLSTGVSNKVLQRFQRKMTPYLDAAISCSNAQMTFRNKARIDRIYLKNHLQATSFEIIPNVISHDHDVLVCEWKFKSQIDPPWRIEPWVFKDPVACENLEKAVNMVPIPDPSPNQFDRWETFKNNLTNATKTCQSSEKRRQRKIFLNTRNRARFQSPREANATIKRQFNT